MPLINYSKVATQRPDLVAPWHQSDRALYFRTEQQASEWASEFGGTVHGRTIRVDDETGECDERN
jgi:hypothetical protein